MEKGNNYMCLMCVNYDTCQDYHSITDVCSKYKYYQCNTCSNCKDDKCVRGNVPCSTIKYCSSYSRKD